MLASVYLEELKKKKRLVEEQDQDSIFYCDPSEKILKEVLELVEENSLFKQNLASEKKTFDVILVYKKYLAKACAYAEELNTYINEIRDIATKINVDKARLIKEHDIALNIIVYK